MSRPGGILTLAEVAAELDVHYMTAYRYVRTGRLPGTKSGTEWRMRRADLDAFIEVGAEPAPPSTTRGRRRIDWAARVEERVLAGDEPGAWSVLDASMAAGMEAEAVYLDVLAPALVGIGDRWALGTATVADEHLATAIVLRLVGRLGPRFARRGRKRGTIVTAAPDGERHGLPVALLADVLRGRGYHVLDLGASVPADSLAAIVGGTDRLVAVTISATTDGYEGAVIQAVAAVRSVTAAPVLVGGRAVGDPDQARDLGADAGGGTTRDLLDLLGAGLRSTR